VVAYFLLGLLGRTTIKEGEVLSFVWPAAGAAMLLFGLTAARRWLLVSVLVALATVVLNMLTGAAWTQVAIFVASNVTQAISAVLILRALVPHLRGAGGTSHSNSFATTGRSWRPPSWGRSSGRPSVASAAG